jgi:hemoglobin
MNQNQRTMKKEIITTEQVKELVDKFYEKVNNDLLLSPVFNTEANVNWETHLPKMYRFWGTQLIGTADYTGRPFPPHMELNIGKEHFERWLQLFLQTVDENFTGAIAITAKEKAANIAAIFQYKLGLLAGS